MKTYKIINPSDPYTFLAPDLEVAALVIFLLSTKFGAECLDHPGDEEDVPIFLLGGAQEWWDQHFDPDMKARLAARAREVATALRSTLYGGAEAHKEFETLAGPIPEGERRAEMRKTWNDEKRSSLTDISRAAYANADWLDQLFKAKEPT